MTEGIVTQQVSTTEEALPNDADNPTQEQKNGWRENFRRIFCRRRPCQDNPPRMLDTKIEPKRSVRRYKTSDPLTLHTDLDEPPDNSNPAEHLEVENVIRTGLARLFGWGRTRSSLDEIEELTTSSIDLIPVNNQTDLEEMQQEVVATSRDVALFQHETGIGGTMDKDQLIANVIELLSNLESSGNQNPVVDFMLELIDSDFNSWRLTETTHSLKYVELIKELSPEHSESMDKVTDFLLKASAPDFRHYVPATEEMLGIDPVINAKRLITSELPYAEQTSQYSQILDKHGVSPEFYAKACSSHKAAQGILALIKQMPVEESQSTQMRAIEEQMKWVTEHYSKDGLDLSPKVAKHLKSYMVRFGLDSDQILEGLKGHMGYAEGGGEMLSALLSTIDEKPELLQERGLLRDINQFLGKIAKGEKVGEEEIAKLLKDLEAKSIIEAAEEKAKELMTKMTDLRDMTPEKAAELMESVRELMSGLLPKLKEMGGKAAVAAVVVGAVCLVATVMLMQVGMSLLAPSR